MLIIIPAPNSFLHPSIENLRPFTANRSDNRDTKSNPNFTIATTFQIWNYQRKTTNNYICRNLQIAYWVQNVNRKSRRKINKSDVFRSLSPIPQKNNPDTHTHIYIWEKIGASVNFRRGVGIRRYTKQIMHYAALISNNKTKA